MSFPILDARWRESGAVSRIGAISFKLLGNLYNKAD